MSEMHTVIKCTVQSNWKHAWSELWRKTYETKDFIDGLSSLDIVEKNDSFVIRIMKVGPHTIKENITRNEEEGTVYFKNMEGSAFSGEVINTIKRIPGKENELELIFASNCHKNGEKFPPEEMFQKAMFKTRDVIEKTNKIV